MYFDTEIQVRVLGKIFKTFLKKLNILDRNLNITFGEKLKYLLFRFSTRQTNLHFKIYINI